jgi:hypothetical protein
MDFRTKQKEENKCKRVKGYTVIKELLIGL